MKYILTLLIIVLLFADSKAQNHEIISPSIRTLRVVADDDWLGLPIIQIDTDERVKISFDDLTHEYHRYTYRVEHCEADWTLSEGLFEADYIDGFYNGLVIEDYSESFNTATLYNHYELEFPNDKCRVKLSGNYRMSVYDENDGDRLVLRAYFMVVDPKMSVTLLGRTNTDIDVNHSHQQIEMSLSYNSVNVTDPDRQLHTVVLQNNRWATARRDARWQFQMKDGLKWQHCRDYIFDAGNEYRKFEFLDLHRVSMGIEHASFDGERYHSYLFVDSPRRNYSYDESANGSFLIRNTYDYNNDTESEYEQIHFTYKIPENIESSFGCIVFNVEGHPMFNGEVFVNGDWTYDRLTPRYRMAYDMERKEYHCEIDLKMGYYSYQYLLRRPDGSVVRLPTEGQFSETENQYAALVYYRPQGGRTDLLYGFAELRKR